MAVKPEVLRQRLERSQQQGLPSYSSDLEGIREAYGVPARKGARVTVDGKPGTILSGRMRPGEVTTIKVRMDGGQILRTDPTFRVVYARSTDGRGHNRRPASK